MSFDGASCLRGLVGAWVAAAAPLVAYGQSHPLSDFDRMVDREVHGHPPAVKAFVERQIGCNHFWGEVSGNELRDAEVRSELEKLKCDRLEPDERTLARRFPKSAPLMRRAHEWQP
jgi:hypothetical protein